MLRLDREMWGRLYWDHLFHWGWCVISRFVLGLLFVMFDFNSISGNLPNFFVEFNNICELRGVIFFFQPHLRRLGFKRESVYIRKVSPLKWEDGSARPVQMEKEPAQLKRGGELWNQAPDRQIKADAIYNFIIIFFFWLHSCKFFLLVSIKHDRIMIDAVFYVCVIMIGEL